MIRPEDRVRYEPRADASQERQRRALAGLYRRVIDLTERKHRPPGEASTAQDAARPDESGTSTE